MNIDLTLGEARFLSLITSYLHDSSSVDEMLEGHHRTLIPLARKIISAFPEAKWSTEYGTFGELAQRAEADYPDE